MGNENRIVIRINADGTAAVNGISQVTKELSGMEKAAGNITSLIKSHWLGITAGIVAAGTIAKQAWDMSESAANMNQSTQAFNSMVSSMGQNAEIEFERIRQSSAGLIDEKSLTESANRALSLGIPVEKMGALMEVARAKARDMGITTAQAFSDIATGVGRASPMILDNLGLTLRLGEANSVMAKQLHKSVDALTDKEKKQAILNATLQAGEEALKRHNLQELTSAERMQATNVKIENMKHQFSEVALVLTDRLLPGMERFLNLFDGFTVRGQKLEKIDELNEKIAQLQENVKWSENHSILGPMFLYDAKAIEDTKNKISALTAERNKLLQNIFSHPAKAPASAGDSSTSLSDTEIKKIEDMNKQIQSQIDKASLSAFELIDKEAKAYRDAGAKKQLVDKWVYAEKTELQNEYMQELATGLESERKRSEEITRNTILARAEMMQKDIEAQIAMEQKLNLYRQKEGSLSEEEAIKRRFAGETAILRAKQETLLVQMEQAKTDLEHEKIFNDFYALGDQIRAQDEYMVYEIGAAKIETQRQLNEMYQQEQEIKRQTNEQAWQAMFNMANQVDGEMGQGLGRMIGGLKGISDIETGIDPYSKQLDQLQEYMRARASLQMEGKISELDMESYYMQASLQMNQLQSQQKLSIVQNTFGMMAGMAQTFYALSNNQSKAAFAAYKAFAVAETAMATYAAAQLAYKAGMSTGGPWAPVVAAAYAASAIATGLARVKAITDQQPGNGAVSAGSVPVGGGYSYNNPTQPRFEPTQPEETKQQARPQVINHYNITIEGNVVDHDRLARELIPAITKANGDMGN